MLLATYSVADVLRLRESPDFSQGRTSSYTRGARALGCRAYEDHAACEWMRHLSPPTPRSAGETATMAIGGLGEAHGTVLSAYTGAGRRGTL